MTRLNYLIKGESEHMLPIESKENNLFCKYSQTTVKHVIYVKYTLTHKLNLKCWKIFKAIISEDKPSAFCQILDTLYFSVIVLLYL